MSGSEEMKIRGDRGEALCAGNLMGGVEISLNSQSVVAAVNVFALRYHGLV